jgi:hypothetical protein
MRRQGAIERRALIDAVRDDRNSYATSGEPPTDDRNGGTCGGDEGDTPAADTRAAGDVARRHTRPPQALLVRR